MTADKVVLVAVLFDGRSCLMRCLESAEQGMSFEGILSGRVGSDGYVTDGLFVYFLDEAGPQCLISSWHGIMICPGKCWRNDLIWSSCKCQVFSAAGRSISRAYLSYHQKHRLHFRSAYYTQSRSHI
ncbi:hypothetical protein M440DRAFT_328742 [Trichoderma longibrachiatum ATCC 18648]|uniref:Uncharacterized protein n=1 Tax=Trichoderma longibrachiatum ATCC 18648 TaxID=983965 RepID=A0A2T4C2E5_TRILO|nr:hypothetical protein M440DRAFT_328742 [Trichoderma longibrachiatum ATCC 18648]